MDPLEDLSVDFLLLADRAEAINSKLYVMGGTWDWIQQAPGAPPTPFSIAVGVLVQWNATNIAHQLRLWIDDEDGQPAGIEAEATFTMGRPAHLKDGDEQRFIMTIPSIMHRFRKPGQYVLTAALNGDSKKQARFRVVAQADSGQEPPPS